MLTRILLVALAVLALAATPEQRMLHRINDARVDRGLERLELRAGMSLWAEHWSGVMAEDGEISHSTLDFPKPNGWTVCGENVGVGTTISGLHRAFMRSPGHRENILRPAYRWIGLGVRRVDGALWITVEFCG